MVVTEHAIIAVLKGFLDCLTVPEAGGLVADFFTVDVGVLNQRFREAAQTWPQLSNLRNNPQSLRAICKIVRGVGDYLRTQSVSKAVQNSLAAYNRIISYVADFANVTEAERYLNVDWLAEQLESALEYFSAKMECGRAAVKLLDKLDTKILELQSMFVDFNLGGKKKGELQEAAKQLFVTQGELLQSIVKFYEVSPGSVVFDMPNPGTVCSWLQYTPVHNGTEFSAVVTAVRAGLFESISHFWDSDQHSPFSPTKELKDVKTRVSRVAELVTQLSALPADQADSNLRAENSLKTDMANKLQQYAADVESVESGITLSSAHISVRLDGIKALQKNLSEAAYQLGISTPCPEGFVSGKAAEEAVDKALIFYVARSEFLKNEQVLAAERTKRNLERISKATEVESLPQLKRPSDFLAWYKGFCKLKDLVVEEESLLSLVKASLQGPGDQERVAMLTNISQVYKFIHIQYLSNTNIFSDFMESLFETVKKPFSDAAELQAIHQITLSFELLDFNKLTQKIDLTLITKIEAVCLQNSTLKSYHAARLMAAQGSLDHVPIDLNASLAGQGLAAPVDYSTFDMGNQLARLGNSENVETRVANFRKFIASQAQLCVSYLQSKKQLSKDGAAAPRGRGRGVSNGRGGPDQASYSQQSVAERGRPRGRGWRGRGWRGGSNNRPAPDITPGQPTQQIPAQEAAPVGDSPGQQRGRQAGAAPRPRTNFQECPIKCGGKHLRGSLQYCNLFRGLSISQRKAVVKRGNICLLCLQSKPPGSRHSEFCKSTVKCLLCSASHSSLLCEKDCSVQQMNVNSQAANSESANPPPGNTATNQLAADLDRWTLEEGSAAARQRLAEELGLAAGISG